MTSPDADRRLCATCGGRLLPCRVGDDDAFVHDSAAAAFDCADLRGDEPIRPMPETIRPIDPASRFDPLAIDTDRLGWTEPPADPTGVDCFERYEGIEP